MVLQDISPRDYQKAILETAKNNNTLVVLPTGVGKTLIALMLAVERLEKHPDKKILFLAPTKPLVEQHLASFKKILPELFAQLEIFTGTIPAKTRKKLWDTSEIIFSTPQCVANDISNYLYDLKEVSLLIIDEAHRCLKNYDYTKVARQYKSQAIYPRILGLTASPGSDSGKVKQICDNLNIEKIEIRTRDSEDVKPYLQELEFEKHLVPFPKEFLEIKVLLKRIYDNKVNQLRERSLLFGPANKITLLTLQGRLAAQANQKNGNAMYGMSLTAQAIKISHALELLETQTLSGLNTYLSKLVKESETKKSKGVQTIVNSPEFQASLISLKKLLAEKIEHPKVEELKVLIENEFKKNRDAKVIAFTQFRDTASVIKSRLKEIPEAKPEIFVGQAKKSNSSGSTGLSQKEQKQIIEKFREGIINILIATSIGEEGLDIPEVSAVYFYEPIPSAIRKIQRAGRTARLSKGKLAILITKDTRDEINHFASTAREKKMHSIIDKVKTDLKNKPKTLKEFI
ncbi:hypothetical protein CO038_03000 [Candidatus Pacearchaeota archaeon CG_4_9_14_0_2_um_filter_39_13]|nr:DEAD/DEAH box helicase family protein [Candidatus Pacearchaeota archaeon]OIO42163.1 MAG: hypothetical protein AUJ64_04305 [Candidatus Pacearchaeota archaeon CG1_02_39_14]PJC44535.1 MAG: hypothetical protein CO038_03000 [Candidatus Pacearchaeota archaeon CG_4_9_14_0_2_um_filter_39_13]